MLDGVGGQRHTSSSLEPELRPGSHCTEGCVGPQARSRQVRKISPPPGFDPTPNESLYRLSNPGSKRNAMSKALDYVTIRT